MTAGGWGQIVLFVVVLVGLAMPLGNYMARVYTGERVFLTRLAVPSASCTGPYGSPRSTVRIGRRTPAAC